MMEAPVEPLDKIPDEGWRWKAAEKADEIKLPTFTQAIPRKRPPPSPAGITSKTLDKWKEDRMKFPPYTYDEKYLFSCKQLPGKTRVASSTERERLMGFRTNHTLALFKKESKTKAEAEQQEVERQAALGNSFHAVCVAGLLDLWLWSVGARIDPMGIIKISKRAHQELSAPPLGAMCEATEGADPAEASDSELSEAVSELAPQRVEWLRLSQDPSVGWRDVKALSLRLVHHFLHRVSRERC